MHLTDHFTPSYHLHRQLKALFQSAEKTRGHHQYRAACKRNCGTQAPFPGSIGYELIKFKSNNDVESMTLIETRMKFVCIQGQETKPLSLTAQHFHFCLTH